MCCFVLIFSLSSYQRWKYLVEWAVGHQTANIHWGEKIKVSRAREVRCRHAFSQESKPWGCVRLCGLLLNLATQYLLRVCACVCDRAGAVDRRHKSHYVPLGYDAWMPFFRTASVQSVGSNSAEVPAW